MSKKTKENNGFICGYCQGEIMPLTNGSYRNHCPFCLHSKHMDIKPGDRLNDCQGIMKPIGMKYKSGKGHQIIHQCMKCKMITVNKVAQDTEQPDDVDELILLQNV